MDDPRAVIAFKQAVSKMSLILAATLNSLPPEGVQLAKELAGDLVKQFKQNCRDTLISSSSIVTRFDELCKQLEGHVDWELDDGHNQEQ